MNSPCYAFSMSRSPEIPAEPNWYALALKEVDKLPGLQPGEAPGIAAIIVKIISDARTIISEHESASDQRILYFGSKRLILFSGHSKQGFIVAETHIEIIKPSARTPEETTILYIAAKLLMQQIADETGATVKYKFISDIPKMQLWANSKGKVVFGWRKHPYEVTIQPTQ